MNQPTLCKLPHLEGKKVHVPTPYAQIHLWITVGPEIQLADVTKNLPQLNKSEVNCALCIKFRVLF